MASLSETKAFDCLYFLFLFRIKGMQKWIAAYDMFSDHVILPCILAFTHLLRIIAAKYTEVLTYS